MSTPGARFNRRVAASLWLGAVVLVGVPASSSAGGSEKYGGDMARLLRGPGVSNHPVRVVPSADIKIPEGWPVDAGGAVTCLTCHVSFPALDEENDPKLRDFDLNYAEPTDFCAKCHAGRNRRSAAAMHWAAVRVAHITADNNWAARSGDWLDGESRWCLGCHDGVNATESKNTTAWNRGSGYVGNRTGNHPVGVPYPRPARRGSGPSFRPRSFLPQQVRLPGGVVSCVSCHDLYAREQHLLTVPLDGSALCFTCHDMD